MAENKTKQTDASVEAFLETVAGDEKRQDSRTLIDLLQSVSGFEPKMWGGSIIGFGSYHYKYDSGREGDAPLLGFSPRKQALTLYLTYGFEQHADLLQRLGKHSVGKACLYIKRLSDVDLPTLRELIERTLAESR